MPELPAGSVDMVLCDLPYGVTARNAWDCAIPFGPMWAEYSRITKGAVVLTATQPFASALVMSNPAVFKYEWIWRKSRPVGFLNAKKQPLRDHEQVLVFYKEQPAYNPQGLSACDRLVTRSTSGTNYRAAGLSNRQTATGYPRSVHECPSESGTEHPTQKPVALMEYLIKTYTNPGDTVLDNCMGSGTTGVACMNLGRSFIGIEKDPNYFDIAQRRIKEAQERALLSANLV